MVHLTVRVIPRASRSGIAGTRDGALLVRLQSPPVEGAANAELVEVLAKAFDVPKRDVSIESGQRSKLKRVSIANDRQHVNVVLQSLGINPHDLKMPS
jgi:uncharacterized protein (TIGR00251 family)